MKRISNISIIVCTVLISCGLCLAGSLQPTAAPGPTMKTLDEVEPRIAIPGGNWNITYSIMTSGSYYLAGDRTFTAGGTGIFINASNVTLDLKGFTFSGTSSSVYEGIKIGANCKNVEIRNGTVTQFGLSGIADFNDLNRYIRIINVRSISNKANGIYLLGEGNRIENCLVADNYIKGVEAGKNSVITNCIARDNNDVGILAGFGSVITGCSSYNNTTEGISAATGCTISNNICYKNGRYGIYGGEFSRMVIIGNNCYMNVDGIWGKGVIKDNCVGSNTGYGIYAEEGSTVINNTAQYNSGNGFTISIGCTVIGNSAYNNVDHGFAISSNCLVDQNVAYNNVGGNMNTLVDCTVPSGNHAP